MIKLSLILITVSAIAKGFCDSIKFHPKTFPFKSDWWMGRGEYTWNKRTWLETNVLSFLSDGWHLFDTVRIASMLLLVALLLTEIQKKRIWQSYEENRVDNNAWLMITGLTVLGYVYHGIVFEIVYHLL